MRFFVGIDDTDNLESRGTGYVGRTMAELIVANGLGSTGAISRHQLLFDPRVPYTSHNSSLCIEVETSKPDELLNFMISYRDWETDRKSTRLNSSHSGESRMPSSA